MEDIRFYDFEFRLLHIEHGVFSCNWTFYENDIGRFEMHFPLESRLSQIAAEHPYLVAVQGDKQGIVTGRQFTDEGILYGRSCNWILTRFCFGNTLDTEGLFTSGILSGQDPQTICRFLIQSSLGEVTNFTVEQSEDVGFEEVILQSDRAQSVFLLVQELMKLSGGGHRVLFDIRQKTWLLQLTKGQVLSKVLSEDNRNGYQTEYMEDYQDYFTGGYYLQHMSDMGDWDIYYNVPELTNRLPENYAKGYRVILDQEETGLSSYKIFNVSFKDGDYIVCDQKSGEWKKADGIHDFYDFIPSSLSGIYHWTTALEGNSEEEALKNLQEFTVEKEYKVRTEALLYGRDYQLGDLVTLRVKKGSFSSSAQRRITGVNLWYEENHVGEQPIFEE